MRWTKDISHFLQLLRPSNNLSVLWNTAKNVFISAKLSNESFQLRHIDNFNRMPSLIDTPEHTIQGFIVDIACDNFLNIFTHVRIDYAIVAHDCDQLRWNFIFRMISKSHSRITIFGFLLILMKTNKQTWRWVSIWLIGVNLFGFAIGLFCCCI